MSIRRRIAVVVLAFSALTLMVLVLAPTVGSTPISLAKVFDRSLAWDANVDAQI